LVLTNFSRCVKKKVGGPFLLFFFFEVTRACAVGPWPLTCEYGPGKGGLLPKRSRAKKTLFFFFYKELLDSSPRMHHRRRVAAACPRLADSATAAAAWSGDAGTWPRPQTAPGRVASRCALQRPGSGQTASAPFPLRPPCLFLRGDGRRRRPLATMGGAPPGRHACGYGRA